MKRLKTLVSFLLAFVILLPLVFCGNVSALSEDTPTIFIDNEVWYKYSIFPLIRKDGELCVPVSVFGNIDSFSESYDSVYKCHMISDGDKYISVNTESGKYLTHSGETGYITFDQTDRELYIAAEKVSDILGIRIETGIFDNTEVIRFCSKDNLQNLSTLVDIYKSSSSAIGDGIGFEGGKVNRRSVFSVITDISDLEYDDIRALLDLCDSIGIKMTFAADLSFMSQSQNLQFLTEIAAKGHTFAISIDKSSKDPALTQAEKCNAILYRLFKQKTLLVLGKADNALTAKGYKILGGLMSITKITGAGSVNFDKTKLILLDNTEKINLSKLTAVTSAASDSGRAVMALNPLTGN